jgi:cysteine-rich repeat protein
VGIACTSANDESDGAAQSALKGNPWGNNGTVKIQEVGDPLEIPDNDPHVGCKFQIEFRGFDKGVPDATWALVGQAPTGKDTPIANGTQAIGGDNAGGANDVDGVYVVDLAKYDLSKLGDEQPQQGYHLKLTVNAPGSKGADVKHKVFWVHGCNPPPPPDAGPKCGDHHVDTGEECDLGDKNGTEGSGCSKDCKKVPYCGDGCVDKGEECDEGMDNGKPGSGCTADCKKVPKAPYCGDGCVDPGEECDEGMDNGKPGSGCTADCKLCGPTPRPDGGQTW